LSDDSTIEDMEFFAKDSLNCLNNLEQKDKGEFKWQLSFERTQKQIGLIFPGDTINDNSSEFKNV
jgi:hypothetical protein